MVKTEVRMHLSDEVVAAVVESEDEDIVLKALGAILYRTSESDESTDKKDWTVTLDGESVGAGVCLVEKIEDRDVYFVAMGAELPAVRSN